MTTEVMATLIHCQADVDFVFSCRSQALQGFESRAGWGSIRHTGGRGRPREWSCASLPSPSLNHTYCSQGEDCFGVHVLVPGVDPIVEWVHQT